jgi:perosamine synthetase
MLPLFKPSCSELEIRNVSEVLKSGWWGLGPKTEEFEKRFAAYVGVKYAVGVNSATAALDLALKAHDIKDGEIIVPALTFVSTALVGLYNDCKIVFADIDEETLCIDMEDVVRKTTKNTKAIIPVWYGGRVINLFGKWDIPIIEDCAHAAGSKGAGKDNTACWSFHAVKNLATGDGGMITTNDEEIYKKLLPLRWCGINKSTWERSQKKYGWDYSIDTVGYKCHMNDLTAAIGLAQLERIEGLNNKRKLLVLKYLGALQPVKWLTLPPFDPDSAWHMFVVRMEERDAFIDYMLAHGISVGVHYKPLNTYPIFPNMPLPVTDRVWKTLVTLPLYPDMTNEEFDYIISTIKKYGNYTGVKYRKKMALP